MTRKNKGWPGEPKRHAASARGEKTAHAKAMDKLAPPRPRREPYKEALARDLHADGFGPNWNTIHRRLEMQEKVLKRLWDGSTGAAFALNLVYRAGMGKDHAAKKRIAHSNWIDLSGDAKKLLLQEYAYGEEAWTGV